MWKAQGKEPPSWPEGDEQLDWPNVENAWSSVMVKARKYLNPAEFELFPPSLGLGVGNALEGTLDLAIRDHSPVHYVKVTPQRMKVWERVRQALIRDGLVKLGPRRSQRRRRRRSRPASERRSSVSRVDAPRRRGAGEHGEP